MLQPADDEDRLVVAGVRIRPFELSGRAERHRLLQGWLGAKQGRKVTIAGYAQPLVAPQLTHL